MHRKKGLFYWVPLVRAASGGHIEIAKLLIDKGADIDAAITKLERTIIERPDWRDAHKAGIAMLERLR